MYQPHLPSPDSIASARRKLGTAELSVDILQSILSEAPPASVVAKTARAWLHERERSVFCRRLELDALLKERRSPQRAARTWLR
jgi:hypothetical protein